MTRGSLSERIADYRRGGFKQWLLAVHSDQYGWEQLGGFDTETEALEAYRGLVRLADEQREQGAITFEELPEYATVRDQYAGTEARWLEAWKVCCT